MTADDARRVASVKVGDTIRDRGGTEVVAAIRIITRGTDRDLLDVVYEGGGRSRYWSTDALYREGVIL